MAMTLIMGDKANSIQKHSGIIRAINLGFEDDAQSEITSTYIAASLIEEAIDQIDDIDRKEAVEQNLSEWSLRDIDEQREIKRLMVDGELNQDPLLTRCQWLLLMAQDFLLDGKIEKEDFRILKDSIYGPLKGETSDYRARIRLDEELSDALKSTCQE